MFNMLCMQTETHSFTILIMSVSILAFMLYWETQIKKIYHIENAM